MRADPNTRWGRAIAALVAAVAVRALLPIMAVAAEPVAVRVRQADLGQDGSARLVVSVSGALAAVNVGREQAQPNVVVFTDGRDTVSRATFASAIAAAKKSKTPVTTIGLATPDLDQTALRSLATQTGGRAVAVGGSGGLSSA